MAARRRAKDYYEPWEARKSTAWESGFRHPPAEGADPEVLAQWRLDREVAEKRADWILWGSRMTRPEFGATPTGETVVMDGRQIVATVRPIVTDHDNPPTIDEVAGRIVECVTACRGVIDPADVIERTRDLLTDLVNGKADAKDPRVLALLARVAMPGAQKLGNDE